MLEQLKVQDFANYLNSRFKVYYSDETFVEADLIEVLELNSNENLESFSIIFLFPNNSPIEQRNFKLEHPEMGIFELFLVPIGQNEKGIRYESIFNRIIEN